MERTVPSSSSEEITLYIRTYYSLLRSSTEVQVRTLIEAHLRSNSALHVHAADPRPDMAAFIYAILRLPASLPDLRLVVMGQSEAVFREKGYPDIESWQPTGAPARRRRCFYDGHETLAVYIASGSDIDDIIPTLTAYQIERDKLHVALGRPDVITLLESLQGQYLEHQPLTQLAEVSGIPTEDLARLRQIWRQEMAAQLLTIATRRQRLAVRLLSGSLADYRRATRRWWSNVVRTLPQISFEDRPVYFISSNTHSIANMLSGFALQREQELISHIETAGAADLKQEYEAIRTAVVPSNRENFLYYVLKKYENQAPEVQAERQAHEQQAGITRIPSQHLFDVEVQVVELKQLRPEWLDPRLHLQGIEKLAHSDALIINIDFPLGMAAYQLLSEVARNIAGIRGVYIMGKAATLNGRIGDIMIPNVVHDEHSLNTYLFDNCFLAQDVAPHLVYGTVLDNQKAITVRGTFLQNRDYMAVFYREGYTDMEMEAGPFLSSVYEMVRPQRHPINELVNLYHAPFPVGIIHYASDTPMSKGKNLGAQNLSYFGMDPTYASTVAILRSILRTEIGMGG